MAQQHHVVMVPYMGIGHVMPMLVLAGQLASLGLRITFVFPGKQLRAKALGSQEDSNIKSTLEIEYDVVEMDEQADKITCHGLREHHMSNEEYMEAFEALFPILGVIRHKIDELVARASTSIDALILDPFLFYRGIVVDKLENVKIFAFAPVSATSIFCFRHLMLNGFTPSCISVPELSFQLFEYDFPSSIVPGSGHPRSEMHANRNKWMETTCTGLIVNTWEDIEKGSIAALGKTLPPGFGVYPVGPLCSSGSIYFAPPDNALSLYLKDWLDAQAASSVLFVCLGSWICITDDQMEELAMGLESSGVKFLWILRDGDDSRFPWLTEFMQRTGDQGFVHLGWAPQQLILSHGAVGGFLMTSGWNSVIEGLMLSPNGVSFVAWPLYLDHMPTCRLLVNGLRVAVEVKTSEISNPHYGPVKRADVSFAARSAMLGPQAREMRHRAKCLGQAARSAVSRRQLETLVNSI